MEQTVQRLNYWVTELQQKLSTLSESEWSERPSPTAWSKKQILGHLCDSAINNLSRFIKVQYEPQPFQLQRYQQNYWVDAQNYQ